MQKTTTALAFLAAIMLAACNTSKKVAVPSVHPATGSKPQADNILFVKPANGTRAPGNEELAALQLKYKEVTMEQLQQGHFIYTKGACTDCHKALNIYNFGEERWKILIDDMARRAKITAEQKEAVYKYVLAMKATQPR